MTRIKHVGIQQPCSEDWNEMTPTDRGAFCQKCAVDVFDFTNKTSSEIKSILRENLGGKICSHIYPVQERILNQEFEQWQFDSKRSIQRAMAFSLIIVFGLSLFSCSSPESEEMIRNMQEIVNVDDKEELIVAKPDSEAVENRLVTQPAIIEVPCTPDVELPAYDGGIGISPDYEEYLKDPCNN